MFCALLSGDDALIEDFSEEIQSTFSGDVYKEVVDKNPEDIPLLLTLSEVVQPTEIGRGYLDELQRNVERLPQGDKMRKYSIISQILESIWNSDSDEIEDAIQDLLDYHDELRNRTDGGHMIDNQFSIEVCAYVALSYRRGLHIRIESDGIPDNFYNIVL
ncbi:Imm49 family immunity protein [Haloarchaeobius sp. TZWSO28]|uniref:Imm49 family immunity protein n=1 Tax=unclassified Haloarchaeobius TaxID=2614452 RepID=UPI003EBA6319